MKTATAITVVLALGLLTPGDAYGQCQRGGGGRNPQSASRASQAGGFIQTGVNPLLAMQQAARQQAFMQQQFAAQQLRMQQVALREQAGRDQLERRRSAAEQRRAAELARRERVRAANFAKRNAADSQEILVALKGK